MNAAPVSIAKLDDLPCDTSYRTQKNLTRIHDYTESHMTVTDDCLVCCEKIVFHTVGECNHRAVCSLCSMKMRTLFSDMECPICKISLDSVVYTKDVVKKYAEYDMRSLIYEKSFKAFFEDTIHLFESRKLWNFQCTLCGQSPLPTLKALKDHLSQVHKRFYCEICLKDRKVFLHEQVLYSQEGLKEHGVSGNPELQIKPHPVCLHCKKKGKPMKFFSDDQLFEHCTEQHETCFICDKNGIRYQYFKNYTHLESHFRNKHFLCEDVRCLAMRFIVFSDPLELQRHQLASHHTSMSKEESRHLRMVSLEKAVDERDQKPDRTSMVLRFDTFKEDNLPTPSLPLAYTSPSSPPPRMSQEEREERNLELLKALEDFFGKERHCIKQLHKLGQDYFNGLVDVSKYYGDVISIFGGANETTINLFMEIVHLFPSSQEHKETEVIEHHAKTLQMKSQFPNLGIEDQSMSAPSWGNRSSAGSVPFPSLSPDVEALNAIDTGSVTWGKEKAIQTQAKKLPPKHTQPTPTKPKAEDTPTDKFPTLPTYQQYVALSGAGRGTPKPLPFTTPTHQPGTGRGWSTPLQTQPQPQPSQPSPSQSSTEKKKKEKKVVAAWG
uniref:RING-type domain-containing protein n=1 Tax=Arcella intermedia TaxID=1963864 RepID=A0A6B2KZD3_9EUKA